MFRDKALNISFLISFFWHLFWMSMVTVVTVPTGLPLADYSKIYFLGPILKKTAFELMLEESPLRIETTYMQPIIPQYTFEVGIEGRASESLKLPLAFSRPTMFKFSLRDIIREDKIILPHFFKEASSVSLERIGMKSPLKERAVIFKPDKIPGVPMWITQDRESFKIELEFTVSASGAVERVKPIVSSGYPKVDMIGINYLKKWRFAPLESSKEQKDQIGRIEIELKVD